MLDLNPEKKYVRDYTALLAEGCVLFQSREQYAKVMGKEAPLYDPTKRTKMWLWKELPIGPMERLVRSVLARDADTGEVLKGDDGKPFLMPYSFNIQTAMTVNIPRGVAGEARYPGAPAWLPLRPLGQSEHLEFRSGLGPEAGLLTVFSSADAYVVDDQYKPRVVESVATASDTSALMDKLANVEAMVTAIYQKLMGS